MSSGSIHFGLPTCGAQILDRVADAPDLAVRELERLEHDVLGDLVRPGLDHRQRVAGADDDQVEVGLLVACWMSVGLSDELAVDAPDAHCADRAEERQRRDRKRRRGAVDAEDVVRRARGRPRGRCR